MNDCDFDRFEAMWIHAYEMYEKTPSEEVTKLAFRSLKDYSIQQVQHGIEKHIKTCVFFPKPANIRENIEGNIEDQAIHALMKAQDVGHEHGRYVISLCFDDPVLQKTISEFGGWSKFYDAFVHPNDKRHFSEKEFLSLYKRYKKFGVNNCPRSLKGSLTYSQKQLYESGKYKTLFIGDENRAKRLYSHNNSDNDFENFSNLKKISTMVRKTGVSV